MTSVPKPLKFLRGHYGTLKETFETVKSGDNRCAAVDHVPKAMNQCNTESHVALYAARQL